MRFTVLIGGLAARHDQRRKAGGSGRLVGSAVGAVALAASLLVTAPPAGAASLAGAARPLTGSGVQSSFGTPAVWNGTDLVTAQFGTNGNLYAYKQAPGATSWKKELVVAAGATGSDGFTPYLAATATSVQIVSEDNQNGTIWFFQQTDGQTTWSAPQLVGTVANTELPQIAWTGVPGHAGTNSVITVDDGSGDVLFFYQNGGSWTEETVAKAPSPYQYYDPAITATDTGIVIVTPSTEGTFQSWYQPYGGSGWDSDGTMGVTNGRFQSLSVTWDGTNVDVVSAYTSGEVAFLWKSDSAEFWSDEVLPGPTTAQPVATDPAIAFTGSNLVVTVVQQMTSSTERLDFWWQGSTLTDFNLEKAATATSPKAYFAPILLSDANSSGEGAIFAQFSANNAKTFGLDDWTERVGGKAWTKHTVAPA
jgi:hypothetical protein